MTTDLDALAASLEKAPGSKCSVCQFIASQEDPAPAKWDALLAGRRTATAVRAVMAQFGYAAATDEPVTRHRRNGHRA